MKIVTIIAVLFISIFANDLKTKDIYLQSYNYEYMGKYNEAIKVLTPLYKKYPKSYTLNLRTGYLFLLSKKYSNAIKYYKKASVIIPSSVEPRLALININLLMENYKVAQELSYELLKIDYYSYYGNLYVIKALYAQKKYDDAKIITNKMLALYPTSVVFLEQLYKIYKATNSKYTDDIKKNIGILDPNNLLIK
jgi:tetratricopeptide (TPR) repeat protein